MITLAMILWLIVFLGACGALVWSADSYARKQYGPRRK